jgi:hypothetical protein
MNLNLRSTGLALVTALVVVAASAPAALAANEFHAEKAPYALTGTQTEAFKFTTDLGNAECKGAKFTGTVSSATSSVIELSPEFSECTALGQTVDFHKNGCGYNYFIEFFSADGTGHGYLNISCPPGKEITYTLTGPGNTVKCTIHVPPQVEVRTVTFTDTGMSQTRGYKHDHKIVNLKYSITKGTGLGACAEALNTSNGEMTGATQVSADEDPGSAHVGIWTE